MEVGAEVRYRMLETLRMYAGERLDATGEADAVVARLLDHFLVELAGAENGLRGRDQLAWLDRIEADHDTVRTVLDWAVTREPARGLRLAGMLGWFWYLAGSGSEAQRSKRSGSGSGACVELHSRATPPRQSVSSTFRLDAAQRPDSVARGVHSIDCSPCGWWR